MTTATLTSPFPKPVSIALLCAAEVFAAANDLIQGPDEEFPKECATRDACEKLLDDAIDVAVPGVDVMYYDVDGSDVIIVFDADRRFDDLVISLDTSEINWDIGSV